MIRREYVSRMMVGGLLFGLQNKARCCLCCGQRHSYLGYNYLYGGEYRILAINFSGNRTIT